MSPAKPSSSSRSSTHKNTNTPTCAATTATQGFSYWKFSKFFYVSTVKILSRVCRVEIYRFCKHVCECICANGWYWCGSCKIQPEESGSAYHTKLPNSINLLDSPAARMSSWSPPCHSIRFVSHCIHKMWITTFWFILYHAHTVHWIINSFACEILKYTWKFRFSCISGIYIRDAVNKYGYLGSAEQ